MGFECIHGDNLEVLRAMASGTVDAVVTNPPEGFEANGELWDEFQRVLKPGGNCVAFGHQRASQISILLGHMATKGSLILDPFMRAGDVGVACARDGYRFIGIDRDEACVAIARASITSARPADPEIISKDAQPKPPVTLGACA